MSATAASSDRQLSASTRFDVRAEVPQRRSVRSRIRPWIPSATCPARTSSSPSRSATVRATRSTLLKARAERPRRVDGGFDQFFAFVVEHGDFFERRRWQRGVEVARRPQLLGSRLLPFACAQHPSEHDGRAFTAALRTSAATSTGGMLT